MKTLSILFVLFFVTATIHAQTSSVSTANTQTDNSIDAQIRSINQNFRTAYNLSNDQQLALKKAVGTFVENIRKVGKNGNYETDRNNFHNQIKNILPADQYNHYKNVQMASVNQQLSGIINTVKNTTAPTGK
jgi:guanyl-specific ribonuclease Sa